MIVAGATVRKAIQFAEKYGHFLWPLGVAVGRQLLLMRNTASLNTSFRHSECLVLRRMCQVFFGSLNRAEKQIALRGPNQAPVASLSPTLQAAMYSGRHRRSFTVWISC